jgi:TRAP-type C4-dicarboxylate transport system permease small subunit
MIRLPEEVLVFVRLAIFGLGIGAVYWFIAYEVAGTVLLVGFGIATAVAGVILWARSRKATRQADGWPFGPDRFRVPAPAYAPLQIGIGAGIVALGVAFGPLLALIGMVLMVIGARAWLAAVMRESDQRTPRD